MTWEQRSEHLKFDENYSWNNLVKTLKMEFPDDNLCYEKIRSYLRRHPRYSEYKCNEIHNVETHRKTVMLYKGDGSFDSEDIIKATQKDISDKTFLLIAHGFNPEEWDLAWAKNSIYNVQLKGGITETYYASKITVKPKTSPDAETMLRHFIEQADKYSPVKLREIKTDNSDKMLLINICDLHLGQLSWGAESGENYDYKIACNNAKKLIEDIIQNTSSFQYSQISFIFGNDFFNIDNIQGTTTKGTQQCNDVRWPKMFDVGCDLLVWMLNAISQAFPNTAIKAVLVHGNHDAITIYAAARYLAAWFKNDNTITFDISPKKHKGFAYGNTALLFTHGEGELRNLDWVYTEFRHLIGSTKVTEIHAGHDHRIRVEEKNGAIIKKNPSPAALSAWAYGEGYNSISQTISRIYDKEQGLKFEIYSKV